MNTQFVEIIHVPILGWAARPSFDTTVGALSQACEDLNLTVLILENEVHLALADPNQTPPKSNVLATCLFGSGGTVVEEIPKPPTLVNIEAQAAR